MFDGWFVCGVYRHFQQYSSYIVAVNFICGGNRSTRRKRTTCRKSLTNLFENKWSKMQRYIYIFCFHQRFWCVCFWIDWQLCWQIKSFDTYTELQWRQLLDLMCFRFYIECIKYIATQPNFDGRLFSTDCLFLSDKISRYFVFWSVHMSEVIVWSMLISCKTISRNLSLKCHR